MKRTKSKHDLTKIWPVFIWCDCSKCKKEFRRESGYKFISGPYHGGSGRTRYICAECAPSIEAAIDYVNSEKWIRRPKYPPAPPPPPPHYNHNRVMRKTQAVVDRTKKDTYGISNS